MSARLPAIHAALVALACLVAALGGAGHARAGDAPARVWPDGAAIADLAGMPVRLPSHSPFGLPDVGAGGVLHTRELTYARQLAAMGIAALVIDSFGARRDRAQSFIARLFEITEAMLLTDAFAGLRYLAGRAEVDAGRVALVGFSYGAMASVFAACTQVAERYAPGGRHFAGHVAFYGPCIVRFAEHRTTGAPVLFLSGGADAIVDQRRCGKIASDLRAGGSAVKSIFYEHALHQWDGGFAPRMIGRNLAGCRFVVERSGVVRDDRLGLPLAFPLLRKLSLALCTASEGYMIGLDDAVRARSKRDLGRFLARVFGAAS